MGSIDTAFSYFLDTLPAPYKTYCCAVSGGPDSIAMLYLLHRHTPKNKKLLAVHCHHGLRPHGEIEMAFVKTICAEWGIPLHVVQLQIPQKTKSDETLENRARIARHRAWKKLAMALNAPLFFLAHHADDQIENLWLRAMRGSNLSALIAPAPLTTVDTLKIARPLLAFTKSEILHYLDTQHIAYQIDESNLDPDLGARNYLRNTILPQIYEKFPFAHKGLVAALQHLQDDKNFIEETVQHTAQKIIRNRKILRADYTALHPAIQCRILRNFIQFKIPDFLLTQAFIQRVNTTLLDTAKRSVSIPIIDTFHLRITPHFISLEKRDPPPTSTVWDPQKSPIMYFQNYCFKAEFFPIQKLKSFAVSDTEILADADTIAMPFQIRPPNVGESFVPWGRTRGVRIKKLATDAKLSAYERQSHPLICTFDNQVLWFTGLRRATLAPITPTTQNVLKISVVALQNQDA